MYAVLFDIDGTLLQTGGAGSSAFAEAFSSAFQLTKFPEGIAFAGRCDRAIANEIMLLSGIEPSAENWGKFFTEYQQHLGAALDSCSGKLLPGVIDLIDTLEANEHVAIGLLTGNSDFGAQAKITAYGLSGRFSFGGYGNERTDRNEIAVDTRQAAEEFVASLSNQEALCGTMVIGDTPADVACGRAIDAFVVAVATGSHSREELAACEPDLLLEDLRDQEALLAEVVAAEHRCLELAAKP